MCAAGRRRDGVEDFGLERGTRRGEAAREERRRGAAWDGGARGSGGVELLWAGCRGELSAGEGAGGGGAGGGARGGDGSSCGEGGR